MRHSAGVPCVLPVLLALQCGVVFLHCSASSVGGDVSALIAFKRAIIEDPHSALADWTDEDGNACDWHAVICSSPQGSVISLKLSNSSLKGFIAPELGQLSFLQEMYLDHNQLFGTIPKQLGSLRNLRVLDLGVNRLTGPIPRELGGLSSINVINFHSNGLTGNIPPELGKLQNLIELRLDRNRLKGSIPLINAAGFSPTANSGSTAHNGLCPSPRLYVGDFSYNFLLGKIPPCLKYLPRSSFQGNCLQDEYSIRQRAFQICIRAKIVHGLLVSSCRSRRLCSLSIWCPEEPFNLLQDPTKEVVYLKSIRCWINGIQVWKEFGPIGRLPNIT